MDTYYKKSEEERRADYLKIMPLLSVFAKTEQRVNIRQELVKELLKISGFSSEEVESMEASSLESAEIQQMVKQRLLGAMANNGNRQKVISVGEVKEAIGQGWEYVDQLPNNEAIVKLP